MKIKNLAFFGIMAAILGVNGAARADSTTIIASQAYVDAKDALKQDQDKRYENTLTTYNGLGKTDEQQKEDYPSMYTLKQAITTASSDASNMKDTAASATWDADDHELDIVTTENTAGNKTDKVATSNQVQTSISALKSYTDYTKQAKSTANYSMGKSDGTWEAMSQGQQDALNSGIDSTKVAQITTNANNISTNTGNISANTSAIEALNKAIEKGLTAAQETAYHDWIDPEKGNREIKTTEGSWWMKLQTALATDVDNVVSDYQKDHQNLIPRNRNIQKGIAYLKGHGIEHYTAGVTNGSQENTGIANADVKAEAQSAWRSSLSDDYVPTVASVERRILEVEETADGAIQEITEGSTNGTINVDGSDIAVHGLGSAAFTASTDYATDAQGTLADNAVRSVTEGATNGTISVNTGGTTAEVAVHGLGSAAYVSKGANTADSTANSLVTVNANGFVTGTATAGALAKKSAITYSTDTDWKLSNVDVTGQADSAYSKCTKRSPCTLTFVYDNNTPIYEWTNMDTEETDALL